MPRQYVVDADGHVMEPMDLWPKYLEAKYLPDAPRYVTDNRGRQRRMMEGRLVPMIEAARPNPMAHTPRAGGYDPRARLKDMDSEGMDAAVLFPSMGLHFGSIQRLDLLAAMCRAENNWMRDYAAASKERLIGIATLPQADIGEMLIEARRSVEDLGFRGVFLRPNPIAGRTLDNPYFEPLWSLLEDLNVPLCIHEGTTQNVPQAGLERYDNFLFRHMVSHAHEEQMACMEIICGGVLERHPKLTVIFLESGCGWIAHWLERMDHHAKYWGYTSVDLPKKPSEYFSRQCYISADPDEKIIPGIIEAIGDDTLLFASDYPHGDGIFPGVVAELADRTDVSEKSKAKIFAKNPAKAFGLKTPAASRR